MLKNFKTRQIAWPLAIFLLTFPSGTLAFCPVCTVAVGAGLGLSRYLKIDDLISGVWIGAVLMSASLWFAGYLKKKKLNALYAPLFALALYAFTFVPLKLYGVIGHAGNSLYKIDKLIIGTIIGTIAFPIAASIHVSLKKRKGKSYFPFQSVAIPVALLLIISIIIYLVIK
ncbi:MAG: hypothetical protein BWY43_00612 [candidate division WS2 bacterium ADurb.Bin280]|uniref:Uncharacterized protein n=1 Tax=candidate division WS2 bacterium ADurb.Bin280 TaxID=1852829 RepID=A0A1V5SCE1_9BACT|nr:MAG: hypothetical protein BWY43_00612 [candidate division WS2 bacterium ADurb.Bin280]